MFYCSTKCKFTLKLNFEYPHLKRDSLTGSFPFQIVASIQKLPAASVLTDINFPMKGRKGMVDWARNSEDRVVIPKSIFTPMSSKGNNEK